MSIHPHTLAAVAEARDAILEMLAGDDDLVALRDSLEASTDVMELTDSLLAELDEAEMLAEALSAQIAAKRSRATRLHQRAQAIRDGLYGLLRASGLPKLERPAATVSTTRGRMGLKLAPDFTCPTQLTKRPEPDTAAIKRQVEAGESIPGAWLERGPDALTVRRS